MTRVLLSIVIAAMAAGICLGEIYLWTDEAGIKHFSNVDPPPFVTTSRVIEHKSPRSGNETEGRPATLFKAVTVYDGDSIKIKGPNLILMVRLAAIDAPETGHGKLSGQPFSQEAKELLETLLSGEKITIKSHGTDMYNRQLAEVFTNGVNVNLELLKAGMAEVYRGDTVKGIDIKLYREAEDRAKRSYRGIWSLGTRYEDPKSWRRAHPRK